MKPLLAFAAICSLAFADPRIVFTKSFPGSDPAYMSVTIDSAGNVAYKEAPDDDPDKFQIEPENAAAIFNLAEKLGHFKKPLESKLKVAKMGDKTFRWEDGADNSEATFNYTTDEKAQELQDHFERISETQRLFWELQTAIRHDRLGVNDATLHLAAAWNDDRLVGLARFLPLLDRVAKDEVFVNMARDRAGNMADAIRSLGKTP